MNDLAGRIIEYFGTATLMSVSNIYTIALTFYGAVYMILWYFRRGERYKMFPNLGSGMVYIFLMGCAYMFVLGQNFDPSMEYYPFAFFSNLVVLCTLVIGFGGYIVVKYLVELREKLPKQD